MLSGNLRNMKQRVDSGSKLYECAKICHTGNFTLYNIACGKFLSRCKPRILLREFQRKGDLLTVDLFDKDFQFLSNCKYLLRILHSAPGHLRDMKQAVRAAKINKSAEICNVLHNACHNVACMDSLHKLFLFLSLLSKKKLLAVTDDAASSGIELSDHEFDLLSRILGQISLIGIGNEACRNEYSGLLDIHAQSAVKYLGYRRFQNFLCLKCFLKTLVAFLSRKSLVSQDNLSFAVVYFQYFRFHGIAHMHRICEHDGAVVRVLALCNNTVCLISDIQDDLIIFHIDDSTLHDLSISDCFYGIFQHLFKT